MPGSSCVYNVKEVLDRTDHQGVLRFGIEPVGGEEIKTRPSELGLGKELTL